MDSNSQRKVIAAGFTIIRCDDTPSPRIKYKGKGRQEWATLATFETKAARDRRFKELNEMSVFIND